jgi:small subunit ribosomal protein S15
MEEEAKPEWVSLKPSEIEKIVIDLAKQGETPAKIGLILRDKHGVPKTRIINKKITQILKEAKISFKSDEEKTKEKIATLEKHISKNNHDYAAKRAFTKKLWLVKKA